MNYGDTYEILKAAFSYVVDCENLECELILYFHGTIFKSDNSCNWVRILYFTFKNI